MLIVAVHDVAPSTLDEVRWLLGRLDQIGVSRRVLKVIPSEPGAGRRQATQLAALVQAESAAGSEIVMHGWTHRAEGPPRGTATDRLRARLFAGDVAEFLSIDPAEMRRRLGLGREWLRALGIEAQGFCPPAWLAAPGLPAAAREEGYRYLVTLRGIRDLEGGRRMDLPPSGYMGAGAGLERLVSLGAAVLSRPLATLLRAPRRIFLHPQGASRSPACATVLREIERLASVHRAATYAELLDA